MPVKKVWICGHCPRQVETNVSGNSPPDGWQFFAAGEDWLCSACTAAWLVIFQEFWHESKK